METVFITILDLSEEARIRYCSDSIEDILGYLPHEVTGRSCWDYFHPEEVPYAREIHGRGVSLDKASVMNYCRVQHKDGSWIGCECVFTVVHDVLVASTSIYRQGPKSRLRELTSGAVRRIFSSSPRDPRYHMLSYLSDKFTRQPDQQNEPRAALFLNRFTRTSTVMFATNGVSTILGLGADELIGRSFYYCIAENCLSDAVKTLESAKANDSIAYLRFRYRNPLQTPESTNGLGLPDDTSDEDDDGGVPLINGQRSGSNIPMTEASTPRPLIAENPSVSGGQNDTSSHILSSQQADGITHAASSYDQPSTDLDLLQPHPNAKQSVHRSSSGNSTDLGPNAEDNVFDRPETGRSSSSATPQEESPERGIELEAVVSCTSDGLVVILRRAKPLLPHTLGVTEAEAYTNGLFASPWAPQPVLPSGIQQPTMASFLGSAEKDSAESGFMAAIREVAVFAWSLTGINGSLTDYAVGKPVGEAQPPGGLPIWDPSANADPQNLFNGFAGSLYRPFDGMDEPIRIPRKDDDLGSSDDEVLWKRSATMPAWRRPKRRAHGDAFGGDGEDVGDGQNQDGGRKRATKSTSGSGSGSGDGFGHASGSGSTSDAPSVSGSI